MRLQGFCFEALPFYTGGRTLLAEPLPLGSSLAARFGCIYIQDASSMLPALALGRIIQGDCGRFAGAAAASPFAASAPEPLRLVLDMCSSPGGKTSLLADLLGPGTLVLGNEPSQKRLATLRRNLELMNRYNTATISHQGQELPLPSAGTGEFCGFDYILLDPPCSGWGTVEKNPRVMELWQGDRLGPLVGLQRLLLREALRLLRPGGALVYSTCTTNVQENEEQIAWALDELNAETGGALSLEPLAPFAGFIFDAPLAPLAGQAVLRVPQGVGIGQGFYLAALRKGHGAAAVLPRAGAKTRKGRKRGAAAPVFNMVLREALDSPLCDTSMLPPGDICEQGGALYFRHAAGLGALPREFFWRGFPLGKNMRLDGALRGLMPSLEAAAGRGADVLNVTEAAQVQALVSGQSFNFNTKQNEVGLYLNGLPLCRLKARGGRVFI